MDVLGRVQFYLRATRLPPTLFGRLAINDPRLVGDLAKGRTPGRRVEARIDAFIAARGPQPYTPRPKGRPR